MTGRARLARRSVLRSVALIGASALLASCAAPGASTTGVVATASPAEATPRLGTRPSDDEQVSIEFWYGWPGVWSHACKNLAKRYSELYPKVRLNTLEHGWQGEKILPAFAAGNPPDVLEDNNPAEYSARGVLLPFDERLKSSTALKRDNYLPVMWDASLWKGKLYGIPAIEHFCEQGLAINVRMAEEAGLSLDKPPRTWDELWEWANKLMKRDQNGLTQIGFDPLDGTGGWPYSWFNSYGMHVYDPDAQRFVVDDAKHAEILESIASFINRWGADNFASFRKSFGTWISPTSSFCRSRQAMQVNGYWSPGEIVLSCPPDARFAFTWAPVSPDRRGKRFQRFAGHMAMISRESKHPSEAWGFVEFLGTDEAQTISYETAGGFVGTKSWLAKLKPGRYPGLDWYVRSATEADEAYNREPNPYGDWWNPLWYQARDAVIYGDKTAEQAVADWRRQSEAGLERVLKSAGA